MRPRRVILLLLLVLLPIAGVTWWAFREIEAQTRRDIGSEIRTILETTQSELRIWGKERRIDAAVWAESAEVRRAVAAQLRVPRTPAALRRSAALTDLRRLLGPVVERYGYVGFLVIAPDGVQVAAAVDEAVGSTDIQRSDPTTVSSALAGKAALGLPFRSKFALPRAADRFTADFPSMIVAAPVRDDRGAVVAVLAFPVDPFQDFTRIAQLGRTGETGETYAFDQNGRLVTESRFDAHLRQIGLLPSDKPEARGILSIEIRDPGGNMVEGFRPSVPRGEQPLTRMARSAVAGEAGLDLDGYRDYRGVPVVGAWTWDEELGLGLTTEIDVAEAYRSLRITRGLVLTMLGVTVVGAFLMTGLLLNAQQRGAERLRATIDTALDAVITIGIDGRVQEFNPSAEAIFGWTRAEMLGASMAERLIPPELRDAHIRGLIHYLSTGVGPLLGRRVEVPALRRNGERFTIEMAITPLKIGGVSLFTAFIRDVSKHREAESRQTAQHAVTAALAEAVTLAEAIPKALEAICRSVGWDYGARWEPDVNNQVLRYQEHWHVPLLDVEEFVAVSARSTFAPGVGLPGRVWMSGRPAWISDVTQDPNFPRASIAARVGLHGAFGFPILAGDTVLGVMEFFSREVRPPDENLLAMMAAIGAQLGQYIRRRGAEEGLAKLASAVEQTEDAVLIADRDGEIEYVNPAFTKITGYTADESIGQSPRILKSGQHDQAFYQELWNTILAGKTWRGTLINRKKTGEIFEAEETVSAIRNADGVITHFVAVARDITERHRLEEQLRQSQKMEAIGKLAGGIAHDFNNLLTVITGYSELLLGQMQPDSRARKNAEEIRKAAFRAAGLTHQLLAFSRRQMLTPKVLNLNAVVMDLEPMLRRLIGEDIELKIVPGPALGQVKADPSQIEQIVLNLVVNARDAMPRGGHLTIETANVEFSEAYAGRHGTLQSGAYVLVAVSDTGCGMDADTQSRVFEPFFTTKELGKGTGLGLATVYGIVKQSDGYVWVYSEPRLGTTFKIYLPRITHEPDRGVMEAERPPLPRGTGTILLVEDEEVIRELVGGILTENGYTVLTASHSDEAFRLSGRHEGPIHLMVTDVVMPGMSGRELAERLASLRPKMKVLYISGYTDDAVIRHGVKVESMPFLQKPFTPDVLLRKVRETLGEPARGPVA
jgi:PAS domain S-box-containing protein